MLVVDEICSNILFYSASTDSTFKITWRCNGNRVIVEILDHGFPYNPLNPVAEDDEDESLGAMTTHLIDKMIDSAEYQRKNDINRVRLIKYRRKVNNCKKFVAGHRRNSNNG